MDITKKFSFVHSFYYGIGGRLYSTYGLTNVNSGGYYDDWGYWVPSDEYYGFTTDPPSKVKSVSFTFLVGYSLGIGIK